MSNGRSRGLADPLPKRVVVLGHYYPDSFAENIGRSLSEMGIQTVTLDTRSAVTRSNISWTALRKTVQHIETIANRSQRLRRSGDSRIGAVLHAAEPDLVISTDGYLFPDQVERWRMQTPSAQWVLWYPDALANLGSQRCFDAPWDRLFFKDPYLVDVLTRHTQLPVRHLPEACLPSRHRTLAPATAAEVAQYRCGVAVAGNNYPYRMRILESLACDGLRLYGNSPNRWASPALRSAFTGQYVTDRSKFLAFTQACILLNTLHYSEILSANARLFEATGFGAFVVTHSNQGVSQLFEPGKEVVAVDSIAELREAIGYYLGAPEECSEIANAGQRRAHREHTYENRLRSIVGDLRAP